ncbi:MAG: VWA domain-containing protein, partial [Bacillota bacterium]
ELQGDEAEACRSSLDYLQDFIGRILEEELWRSLGENALPQILINMDPAKKDFSRLHQKQLAEMRKYITRLGRQLATRTSRRYRQAARGKLDLRRTLRRAAATGGVPIKPAYRRHDLDRPEMVLLCDVSGSVARFSEFMLQLVYTAQQRFRRLRSFIFVDRLAEVSEIFGLLSIEEAVGMAYRRGGYSNSGLSDFGTVFRIFEQRHLPLLTRRTSLVILGDARNNWRPSRVESLAELSRHAGKTFWLNPRPVDMWYGEDSILAQYQPYCHKIMECRNLEQLEQVSRMIL